MSFLTPIVDSTYGYRLNNWGGWEWRAPSLLNSFSYAPPVFAATYTYPVFGGLWRPWTVSPWGMGSYHYDVVDAGARLLTWGNVIEADPFYRAYRPWFFLPPIPMPAPMPVWPAATQPAQPAAPVAAAAPSASGISAPEAQKSLAEQAKDLERREKELQEKVKEAEEKVKNMAAEESQKVENRKRTAQRDLTKRAKKIEKNLYGTGEAKPGTRTMPGSK